MPPRKKSSSGDTPSLPIGDDCPESAIDFEKSFAELEKSVTALEAGKLSLDEALRRYEEGVKRFRECQTALDAAELRVEQLHRVTDQGTGEFARFADLDDDDAEIDSNEGDD
jgi:exodeoxyribonuclease VII small subunit